MRRRTCPKRHVYGEIGQSERDTLPARLYYGRRFPTESDMPSQPTCRRHLARLLATTLCLAAALASASATRAATTDAFERITPEAAGYSSVQLAELAAFLDTTGSEALLLLHDGRVFFEWGDIRRKRLVHSIRKALLNSLYGVHRGAGCLDLDQSLAAYGIDDIAPSLSAREQTATLRQLLQSRSGVYHPAAAESEGMAAERPARASHAPGTHYYYNNWDFNVAGAIFEKCTGRRIHDAFFEDIAQPLGMLDFDNRITAWPRDAASIDPDSDGSVKLELDKSQYPAYHFRMSAHDLALFGQLYLDHGRWKGRQLIPTDWIDLSTQPYSILNADYGLAYGMLWDVLVPGANDTRTSFFHTGVGVHMLGVYPKHRLVLVHRVNSERDFRFSDGDLYRVIRMVHGARKESG